MLALKYDESASSHDKERPMSTEGSHSSPWCSWVGKDRAGGGVAMDDGASEGAAGVGLPGWLASGGKTTKTT